MTRRTVVNASPGYLGLAMSSLAVSGAFLPAIGTALFDRENLGYVRLRAFAGACMTIPVVISGAFSVPAIARDGWAT